LFEIMHCLGGSVSVVMREKTRREQAFAREQDSTWDWLQLKRDAVRQILGSFIGEAPVDPFAQALAPYAPARPERSQNDVAAAHGSGQRPAPPS
jgi:hypothetical protein